MLTRTLGHRLREGRYSEAGRIYLLTTVTVCRCPVFNDWRLGRLVVHELRDAHEQGWVNHWLGWLCPIICIG